MLAMGYTTPEAMRVKESFTGLNFQLSKYTDSLRIEQTPGHLDGSGGFCYFMTCREYPEIAAGGFRMHYNQPLERGIVHE